MVGNVPGGKQPGWNVPGGNNRDGMFRGKFSAEEFAGHRNTISGKLLFLSKHSMIKSEISLSDLSNLRIFRIWDILATPGGRKMHPERLIMKINVV